jgi:hypothetical protein
MKMVEDLLLKFKFLNYLKSKAYKKLVQSELKAGLFLHLFIWYLIIGNTKYCFIFSLFSYLLYSLITFNFNKGKEKIKPIDQCIR